MHKRLGYRGGLLVTQLFRNGNHEVLVRYDLFGVTATGDNAHDALTGFPTAHVRAQLIDGPHKLESGDVFDQTHFNMHAVG